jgi:hypothetical protein
MKASGSDGQITELSMTHRQRIAANTFKQTPQSIRDALPYAMNQEQQSYFLACLSSNFEPISFPLNLTPNALSILAKIC